MAYKYNKAIFIDYDSNKSRIVVRCVLGAETFELTYSCDSAIVIQYDIRNP